MSRNLRQTVILSVLFLTVLWLLIYGTGLFVTYDPYWPIITIDRRAGVAFGFISSLILVPMLAAGVSMEITHSDSK